jgi:hypothetical protein
METSPTQLKKAGTVGSSVIFPCNLEKSKSPNVQWVDTVYTSNSEPIVIFQSSNNSMNEAHPNKIHFKVDRSNFALTIDGLKFDDAGIYTCISKVGDIIHSRFYKLTVYVTLGCSGNTNLDEGKRTTLQCNTSFSGDGSPTLQWFKAGKEIESEDLYDIRLAQKQLQMTVSSEDDEQTYRCVMKLADKTDECSFIMNVAHGVKDCRFSPDKDKVYSGEEFKCIASGNPAPAISIIPSFSDEQTKAGKGWKSFIVPKDWEKTQNTVVCTAENSFNGQVYSITNKTTFFVEPSPTKPVRSGSAAEGLLTNTIRWSLMVILNSLLSFACVYH